MIDGGLPTTPRKGESRSNMIECYGEEECGTGWRSTWQKLVDKDRKYDNWNAMRLRSAGTCEGLSELLRLLLVLGR
jgi:hypothetical protein